MPNLLPPPIQAFETDRLRIRDWTPALGHSQRFRALEAALADILTPSVLAPLPPPLQLNGGRRAIASWIAARAAESHVFTIVKKPDDALVGLLIMAPIEAVDGARVIHLGYLFAEAAWGQGLATELLCGLVAALPADGSTTLIAGAARDNPASIRVLEKAGFAPNQQLSTADTIVVTRT